MGASKKDKEVSEKTFPKVKELVRKKIKSLPINDKAKKFMEEKVNSIQYTGEPCGRGDAILARRFMPGAMFVGSENSTRLCRSYLDENASDFMIATALAHELAHSIDPCNITVGPAENAFRYKNQTNLDSMDDEYPIAGLISCLRSDKSVHAIAPQFVAQAAAGGNAYPLYSAYGNSRAKYDYCDSLEPDMIGEAFSDWLASEVTTDFIQDKYPNLTRAQWQIGYSNTFRNACDRLPGTTHPAIKDRINAVVLVNPKVREKMGCQKPHSSLVYCDAQNPDLLMQMEQVERAKKMGTSQAPIVNEGAGYGLGAGTVVTAPEPASEKIEMPAPALKKSNSQTRGSK